MALRVFACARGRTCSFHAVCVERVMQGAGSACVGVWEFGLPVGRGEGARRAIRFWVLKELLFTASQWIPLNASWHMGLRLRPPD